MALRFIYCVPLMEDTSGSSIYLLCASKWKIGMALRFSYCVPQWKIGVAIRFIYCAPPMEDRSGS